VLPKLEIYGHHPLSPTESAVDAKKAMLIEQIRGLPGMTPEKMQGIINNM
jgi:CBS domain-containing protein